ncbi:hypothetical protein [Croceicoccus gelatinilyticus]|uniref:hypothetical protein n=1 Tax=Croceicoccus gelatinilyticus TaxID=2835536 RepID=UPI001BD07572|nr:hypothetical protein [Croceicoccus gelatinilyticus]MBS7671385.1 hypothetical protein [Croceicoccus gelatinilyticus]
MEEIRGNNDKPFERDWSIGDYALCINNGQLLLRPQGVKVAIRVAANPHLMVGAVYRVVAVQGGMDRQQMGLAKVALFLRLDRFWNKIVERDFGPFLMLEGISGPPHWSGRFVKVTPDEADVEMAEDVELDEPVSVPA